MLDVEAKVLEASKNVVSLVFEMTLQCFHLVQHFVWLEHGNSGFLEGDIGASVQVGTTGPDCLDKFFWTHDPCHTLGGIQLIHAHLG